MIGNWRGCEEHMEICISWVYSKIDSSHSILWRYTVCATYLSSKFFSLPPAAVCSFLRCQLISWIFFLQDKESRDGSVISHSQSFCQWKTSIQWSNVPSSAWCLTLWRNLIRMNWPNRSKWDPRYLELVKRFWSLHLTMVAIHMLEPGVLYNVRPHIDTRRHFGETGLGVNKPCGSTDMGSTKIWVLNILHAPSQVSQTGGKARTNSLEGWLQYSTVTVEMVYGISLGLRPCEIPTRIRPQNTSSCYIPHLKGSMNMLKCFTTV